MITLFHSHVKFCYIYLKVQQPPQPKRASYGPVPSPTSTVFNAKKLWPAKISLPKSSRPYLSQALFSKDS